jgi:hypothetical protein
MEYLIGIWVYTSLIYQGTAIPRPDENLKMYFAFNSQSENQLFYYRDHSVGHCRRTAVYSFRENKLYQKITEVDPSNSADCAADPDMQPGRESVVDLNVTEHCLYLTLPLGDETLTYVWQRADSEGNSCSNPRQHLNT